MGTVLFLYSNFFYLLKIQKLVKKISIFHMIFAHFEKLGNCSQDSLYILVAVMMILKYLFFYSMKWKSLVENETLGIFSILDPQPLDTDQYCLDTIPSI